MNRREKNRLMRNLNGSGEYRKSQYRNYFTHRYEYRGNRKINEV
jgi:hypothetical protein